MPFSERNIRRLDTLHSRSALFLGSILVLGALLVGTSVISWQSRQQEWEIDSAYARTAEFLDAAHDVELATLQMIRGERGYLLTGRDDYLEPYTEGRANIDDALQRLRALDRNDHGTLSNVATLDRKAQTYIELLDRVVGLARSGRRSEALAQYERCCEILVRELGVEPSAETTELYQSIRSGSLKAPSPPLAVHEMVA